MTAAVLELGTLTDDELAALYQVGGDTTKAAVLAACEDRDARAEQARAARERRAAKVADWESGAYAQYLAAEAATNGYLLSREGTAAGIDPWPALWRGAEGTAMRYASEELREFWLAHPRVTVTGYLSQATDRRPDPAAPEPEPEALAGPPPPPPSAVLREALAATRARRAVVMADAMRQATEAQSVPAGLTRPGVVAERPVGELVPTERKAIDGNELLGYVRAFLARYAVFPSEAALDAVTLWVAAAHARDPKGKIVFEYTGRLMFLSSDPDSGKSRALNLVGLLTGTTFGLLGEPTAAAVASILGDHHEAAFLDESDVLFGAGARRSSIRSLLNLGYQRDSAMPFMSGGKVQARPIFGWVGLAGLDVMKTSTGDKLKPLFTRSVVIKMRPALTRVPALDPRARAMASLIHSALVSWTATVRDTLRAAQPDLPPHLINRAVDVWLPLIAVADTAGGEWPERARKACHALTEAYGDAVPENEAGDVMDELAEMALRWAS